MKKLFALCLVLTIIFAGLPMLNTFAEVGDVKYSYKFSDEELPNTVGSSYSDAPASWATETNSPLFVRSSGKYVYDTGSKNGLLYELASGKTPYIRANTNIANLLDTENKIYTFRTDVKFERAFANTNLVLRFGASGWVQGTTLDANVFQIRENGRLFVKNNSFDTGFNLALDVDYRIEAVMNLTGSNKILKIYVNGELINTGTIDYSTSTDVSLQKKLFAMGYIVRPYQRVTASDPYYWVNTKFTTDNWIITEGEVVTPLTLIGENIIRKSPHNRTIYTSVVAKNNNLPDNFTYEIITGEGTSINANTGELEITPNVSSVIGIKATLNSDPTQYVTKSIIISNAYVKDFESDVAGVTKYNAAYVQKDSTNSNINNYVDANISTRGDILNINLAMTSVGKLTVEFDAKASSNTGGLQFGGALKIVNGVKDENAWWSPASALSLTRDNTWRHVELAIDFDTLESNVYVDDVNVLSDVSFMQVNFELYRLKNIISNIAYDNVKIYNGVEKKEQISIKPSAPVGLIPPLGKSSSIQFSVKNDNQDFIWSLGASYPGITIDPSEGILTVDGNAQEGSVLIGVKRDENSPVTNILYPLHKIGYNFDTTVPAQNLITTGQILQDVDSENKYFTVADGAPYGRITFPDHTLVGRIVVEGKTRLPKNPVSGGTLLMNSYGIPQWTTSVYIGNEFFSEGWNDFKLVFDTYRKTYTAFLNNKIITSISEVPMFIAEGKENDLIRMYQLITSFDVDDVVVYSAGNVAPEAFMPTVKITNNIATAEYIYFSEGATPENCSVVEWFKADTKDGVFVSLGNSFTPAEADDDKYVYFKITPTDAKGVAGSTVQSPIYRISDCYIDSVKVNGAEVSEGTQNLVTGTNKIEVATVVRNRTVEKKVNVMVAVYVGSKLHSVEMAQSTIGTDQTANINCELTLDIEPELLDLAKASVFIMEAESLTPLLSKYAVR